MKHKLWTSALCCMLCIQIPHIYSAIEQILYFKHMYKILINGVNICYTRGDEFLLRFCMITNRNIRNCKWSTQFQGYVGFPTFYMHFTSISMSGILGFIGWTIMWNQIVMGICYVTNSPVVIVKYEEYGLIDPFFYTSHTIWQSWEYQIEINFELWFLFPHDIIVHTGWVEEVLCFLSSELCRGYDK